MKRIMTKKIIYLIIVFLVVTIVVNATPSDKQYYSTTKPYYSTSFLFTADPQYIFNADPLYFFTGNSRYLHTNEKYLDSFFKIVTNKLSKDIDGGIIIAGDLVSHPNNLDTLPENTPVYKWYDNKNIELYTSAMNEIVSKGIPVYDTLGNHDYPSSLDKQKMLITPNRKYSNSLYNNLNTHLLHKPFNSFYFNRKVSNAPHYYWESNGIYFISLALYPGDNTSTSVYNEWDRTLDPYWAYSFLKYALEEINKTDKDAPIVIVTHCPFSSDYEERSTLNYWTIKQQDEVCELVKDYNVIAFLVGHFHNPSAPITTLKESDHKTKLLNAYGKPIYQIISGQPGTDTTYGGIRRISISKFDSGINFSYAELKDPKKPESGFKEAKPLDGYDARPTCDLVISNFSINPTSPTTADQITFTAVVKNQGRGSTSPTKVSIRVGGGSQAEAPRYDVPALEPGATYTVTRTLGGFSPLFFRATATADPDGNVAESDETNNQLEIDFTVRQASPDLTISSFSINPESPTTADQITFTAVVKNQGKDPTFPTKVSIKVGGEYPPSAPRYDVPALEPGATYTITRTENLDVAQGYGAVATADPDGNVAESDETNNQLEIGFTVTQASPDLTISSFSINPESPTTADQITFTAVVKNQGNAVSSASTVSIKVGGEYPPSAPRYDVPTLEPGATYTVTRTLNLRAQSYGAVAIADSDGIIIESDESNNQATIEFNVDKGTNVSTTIPEYIT